MKSKRTALFLALTMICTIFGGYVVMAVTGSAEDPLITLSYLNSIVMPDLETRVAEKLASTIKSQIDEKFAQGQAAQAGAFVAIEVKAGHTVLGADGAELILRSGSAVAVCPGDSGLVNSTQGRDIPGGEQIASNNVHIIPRKDGRGIKMQTGGFIMIKGGYEIK